MIAQIFQAGKSLSQVFCSMGKSNIIMLYFGTLFLETSGKGWIPMTDRFGCVV
jgi:hypothetical protein